MNALLELRNIRHAYGKQVVVNDLSLTLKKGQIGCLLGPSGCGKTTVLRCIAGFEPISAGEILVNSVVVSNAG
ncbi:MAG: ATP-binding cassette domain-containing protein, partial [Nitrosospira sp.]